MAANAASANAKKRPRGDLLASLDAAFASSTQQKAVKPKYTTQAAAQAHGAASQQAYLHKKRKRKAGGATTQGQQQQQNKNNATSTKANSSSNQIGNNLSNALSGSKRNQQNVPQQRDPLYGKLSLDVLAIGMKNCSLQENSNNNDGIVVDKTNAMAEKLRNKVLQFDNPVKTTEAAKKRTYNLAQAQTAKLLSARQRRALGLHLLRGEMKFSDAQQLSTIWKRYARDVIGNDLNDTGDVLARNGRIRAKLNALDLSGCPIEVIQSRNPCNVGISGVLIAEKQHVIQVCCADSGKIVTLVKEELRIRIAMDCSQNLLVDGEWLTRRSIL